MVNSYVPFIPSDASDAAYYSISIPDNIKVWRNADRSGDLVTSSDSFSALVDTTLYAEGTTVGNGTVKLNYSDENTETPIEADRFKITTFSWVGPLNVPGIASYDYVASNALPTSQWIAPTGGVITVGQQSSDVTIRWDAGPAVGRAIYEVNNDYTWDLEVNVVKVSASEGSVIAPENAIPVIPETGNGLIIVGMPGRINFHTTVTVKGAGPDENRGVKFMQVGFSQDVKFTAKTGDYQNNAILTSSLEGQSYLDNAKNTHVPPWYDPTESPAGVDPTLWDPTTSGTQDLSTIDRAKVGTPATYDLTPNGSKLKSLNLVLDFNMYLAVRTKDTSNHADVQYVQRASAAWSADLSGAVTYGNDNDGLALYTPSAIKTVKGPTTEKFTIPTDDLYLPITTPPTGYDALAGEEWD